MARCERAGQRDGATEFGANEISVGASAIGCGGTNPHLVRGRVVAHRRLAQACAQLGTKTIEDTVNEALRLAIENRRARVANALDVLASAPIDDRADAWR